MHKSFPPEYSLPAVALIAAMTRNRVIGHGNRLPWDIPEDLQLFKTLTFGNTILMGRKTFESIGHPLSGRHNIVLSRSARKIDGVKVCPSFIEGLAAAAEHPRPVFVIGGAELYVKALPIAADMHISWIDRELRGDIYFPEFVVDEWRIVEEKPCSGFTYVHYCRK